MKRIIFLLVFSLLMVVGLGVNAQDKTSKVIEYQQDLDDLKDLYNKAKEVSNYIYEDGKEVLAMAETSELNTFSETPPAPTPTPKAVPKTKADNIISNSPVEEAVEESSNAVKTVYRDSKDVVGTVYEDSKGVIGTAYDDTKGAIQYITPKIENAVEEIAKGLKIGATELFKILVLQQVVYSLCYLLVLVLMIYLFKLFRQEKASLTRESNLQSTLPSQDIAFAEKSPLFKHYLFLSIYLAGIVITGAIFFTNIVAFVMGFVNPKYGALMEILQYAEKFIPKG